MQNRTSPVAHADAPSRPRTRFRRDIGSHRFPTCDLSGKRRYRDHHQAQDALESTRRARSFVQELGLASTRNEQRAYPCAYCNGWHLTSRKQLILDTDKAVK